MTGLETRGGMHGKGVTSVGLQDDGSGSVVSSKADLLCENSRQGESAGLRGTRFLSKPRVRNSASNCINCIIKLALGEMTWRRARTYSKASSSLRAREYMMYARQTVAERLIPPLQCTSTLPPSCRSRSASIKKTVVRSEISRTLLKGTGLCYQETDVSINIFS